MVDAAEQLEIGDVLHGPLADDRQDPAASPPVVDDICQIFGRSAPRIPGGRRGPSRARRHPRFTTPTSGGGPCGPFAEPRPRRSA